MGSSPTMSGSLLGHHASAGSLGRRSRGNLVSRVSGSGASLPPSAASVPAPVTTTRDAHVGVAQ